MYVCVYSYVHVINKHCNIFIRFKKYAHKVKNWSIKTELFDGLLNYK